MANPNYTIALVANAVGVGGVSTGQCLVLDATGSSYLVATAANRGTKKSSGIALGGAPVNGATAMQTVGDIPAAISGLGNGAAGAVRVSTTGALERIATIGVGDDVVGYAETNGDVHLFFGGMVSIAGSANGYPALSGLTTGYVLAATGATTAAFQAPAAAGSPWYTYGAAITEPDITPLSVGINAGASTLTKSHGVAKLTRAATSTATSACRGFGGTISTPTDAYVEAACSVSDWTGSNSGGHGMGVLLYEVVSTKTLYFGINAIPGASKTSITVMHWLNPASGISSVPQDIVANTRNESFLPTILRFREASGSIIAEVSGNFGDDWDTFWSGPTVSYFTTSFDVTGIGGYYQEDAARSEWCVHLKRST